jgi:secreted trypsin-like serine protease
MKAVHAFGIAITPLLLSACAAESTSNVGSTRQAIVGGVPDDATESAVFIVVRAGSKDGFCSGVVVSPHVVLTAAHCASSDAHYRIFLGADYDRAKADDSDFVEVVRNVPHPKWDEKTNENDIGVLVTATPMTRKPVGIRRTPLADADLGTPLRIVGFGRTSGSGEAIGRRMQATTKLSGFDATALGFMGTPNICLYDSGGPSYAKVEGEEVVVGIHLLVGAASCDERGLDTRVDAFADFIDAQIDEVEAGAPAEPSEAEPEASADPPQASSAASEPPQAKAVSCAVAAAPRGVGGKHSAFYAGAVFLTVIALMRRRRRVTFLVQQAQAPAKS